MRASTSPPVPAGRGTTIVIVLSIGQSANAGDAIAAADTAARTPATTIR